MSRKELTGYASIDNPQNIGATFFEKHPLIPSIDIYTLLKLTSMGKLKNPAVDCLDLKANYGKLLDDAVTVSLALKELGVRKGDIITIAMPNLYQGLAAYFACNRIGAIATFLDDADTLESVKSYLNLFESPILINFDKDDEYNKRIKSETDVEHIITINKQDICTLDMTRDYSITSNDNRIDYNSLGSIAKHQRCRIELPHSGKEDSLILFTSGSTGKPKPVVLTNQNIIAAEIYAMNTSHTENITGNKTLTCVPFCYPYGLVTSALTSLLWGKETILVPNFNKDTIVSAYKKNPNIVFGSPAALDMTMKYIPEDQDLSSVQIYVSGGDFLPVSQAQRATEFFQEHGAVNVEVGNGSGNAETVSIGSTPVGVPLRQDTAGKLLVGPKVMTVDVDAFEKGEIVEKKYGEEGLLLVSGKYVFKEYYKNPELTKQSKVMINGTEYFITGTIGKIDEQGYFTPTARKTRFYINDELKKVYCDGVQNIISNFECVKSCAVVAVPDEGRRFVNKAYIVLNDGCEPSEEMKEVINRLFLSSVITPLGEQLQLKPYEIPSYIEFINEIPRIQGSEKVDYLFLEKDAKEKLEKAERDELGHQKIIGTM